MVESESVGTGATCMSGLPAATRSSNPLAPAGGVPSPKRTISRRLPPSPAAPSAIPPAASPAASPAMRSSSGSPFSRDAMSTFAPQSPTTKPTSSGVSITLIGFATAPSLWIA